MGIPQPKPMELLEGFMAHRSSFHSANVSGFSTLQCQALDSGTEGPARWCLYSGMAYPFLYLFPASISRQLRRRFQKSAGKVLLLQWRRGSLLATRANGPCRGNEMAPDRTAAIGVNLGAHSRVLGGAHDWYSLAEAPHPSAGSRSRRPCRRSVVHAQSQHLLSLCRAP